MQPKEASMASQKIPNNPITDIADHGGNLQSVK
jgi:hypothetical protein